MRYFGFVRSTLEPATHLVRRSKKSSKGFRRAYMATVTDRQGNKGDHLDRTADHTRLQVVSRATVTRISSLSPTVKGLTMTVHDPTFHFKAGQWVDFFIPGVETVGGYSMCSPPSRLEEEGQLELAVKYSTHPPAHWVHTQCREGSEVTMKAGGDFWYQPEGDTLPHDLLLVAGGVGINPLCSMLLHAAQCRRRGGPGPDRLAMLYSAATEDELIFRDNLQKTCKELINFSCQMHVTKETPSSTDVIGLKKN